MRLCFWEVLKDGKGAEPPGRARPRPDRVGLSSERPWLQGVRRAEGWRGRQGPPKCWLLWALPVGRWVPVYGLGTVGWWLFVTHLCAVW